MKKLVIHAFFCSVFFSCVAPQQTMSNIPMQSHAEVMGQDFPTKKAVFIKFGSPTSKETFDNIENWYYKLSEVTASTSVGHSYGVGRIAQDPMNPYVRILDRALVTQQSQNTFQKTNSTTVETFVKFWFVNDTVIKWETYGVDYSRPIPIISNETNQPTTKPDFASEFLYYEVTDKKFMYSHNSLLRMNNGGVNGPLTFYEADSLHKYHQDFISTLIPSIDQLKKVYDSNSKLRYILLRNSFVVWSSSRSASGNILCMNFRSGDIVENSPDSKCYFVPLVPLNGQ